MPALVGAPRPMTVRQAIIDGRGSGAGGLDGGGGGDRLSGGEGDDGLRGGVWHDRIGEGTATIACAATRAMIP